MDLFKTGAASQGLSSTQSGSILGSLGKLGLGDQLGVPQVLPPAEMPDANSAQAREAARRAQQQLLARSGRTSTILTSSGNRGSSNNFDTYASRTTGAA